jgi:ribosomal-protein-alanine N-acetyltransferase
METIKTERLLLRDLKESDWQAVHEYASDAEVVRYMDWGPNSEQETKDFIQRAIQAQKEQPRRNYTLAITVQAENRLIGSCGIHVSNVENREGWIGYSLNRHFWLKGYATETARALVDFGFRKLGLHRVFATCDPANNASAHVLEKSGMKREGRLREHKWAKGKWRDSYLYAIIEGEWNKP